MRDLNFEVDGQSLRKVGDFSGIIRGSKKYLRCVFSYKGIDWSNMRAIAVFEHNGNEYAVVIQKDGSCMVPDEVTDGSYFKVSVVDVSGKNKKITTNKELINQGG